MPTPLSPFIPDFSVSPFRCSPIPPFFGHQYYFGKAPLEPCSPQVGMLDGAKIIAAIDVRLIWVGIAVFWVVAYFWNNAIVWVIFVLAVMASGNVIRQCEDNPKYYGKVTPFQRVAIGAAYFVCLAVLVVAYEISSELKPSSEEPGAAGGSGMRGRLWAWYENKGQEAASAPAKAKARDMQTQDNDSTIKFSRF